MYGCAGVVGCGGGGAASGTVGSRQLRGREATPPPRSGGGTALAIMPVRTPNRHRMLKWIVV